MKLIHLVPFLMPVAALSAHPVHGGPAMKVRSVNAPKVERKSLQPRDSKTILMGANLYVSPRYRSSLCQTLLVEYCEADRTKSYQDGLNIYYSTNVSVGSPTVGTAEFPLLFTWGELVAEGCKFAL